MERVRHQRSAGSILLVPVVPTQDAEDMITHSGERAMMRAARGRVGHLIDHGFQPRADPPARARPTTAGGG